MKNRFLVLDTETADLSGNVYDIGYVICNKRGEIVLERNWLVEETFTNAKVMMGAFYAGKLFTHYAGMLERGEIKLTPWHKIVKTLDIWQFACETKLSQKQYKRLARRQGWTSPAGNIKTGAEYAYRFCSGDFGFIEDHTALSDARIEAAILAECFKQKKRVPYGKINGAPWRIVNAA